MNWLFIVQILSIFPAVAAFYWLMRTFEGENPRATWYSATLAMLIALGSGYALDHVLVSGQPWWHALIAAALMAAILALSVKYIYRLPLRRALALGSGLPLAWGLGAGLCLATTLMIGNMAIHSPVFTSFLLALVLWTAASVYRHNHQIARRLARLTSWISA